MSDLRRDAEYLAKVIDANVIQYDKNVGADHFGWLVSWIEHYMGKVAQQQREAVRLEGLRDLQPLVDNIKKVRTAFHDRIGVPISFEYEAYLTAIGLLTDTIEAKIAEGGK